MPSTASGLRAARCKSGFAGLIPIGNKFQARIWVAAKKKQQALPRLWDTAEEAALWLAYIKASGLPPPSPKKVKARSGELCPPQCVHMHCPSTLALVARLPAHRLHLLNCCVFVHRRWDCCDDDYAEDQGQAAWATVQEQGHSCVFGWSKHVAAACPCVRVRVD